MSTPTNAMTQVTREEKSISFVPFGAVDTIKLSVKMIQDFIAKPTKQGKKCTEEQALRFLMLCQAQRLNPWQGDCFCIGYDSANGPEFSNVTAHQAFLKRAEASKEFDGMTSGIIVRNKETREIKEVEGDFYVEEEVEVLGGWAKVIRKDRSIPFYRPIRLNRFYKDQSQWKVDAAGMICKCAEADALRSAFPTVCGGLFLEHELNMTAIDVSATAITQAPRGKAKLPPSAPQDPPPALTAPAEPPATARTPQQDLELIVIEGGFTFDQFRKWAVGSPLRPLADADSLSSFEEIKTADAVRLLRAKDGLIQGLKGMAQ